MVIDEVEILYGVQRSAGMGELKHHLDNLTQNLRRTLLLYAPVGKCLVLHSHSLDQLVCSSQS
jgi:hypothetical protein